MDSFCEQLVKIKKTGLYYALTGLIWVVAFLITYITVFISLRISSLIGFFILIIFGIYYLAVKLTKMLNIEFEYIIVNHDMDIDKITAKSSRKRVLSINLLEIQEYGNYNDEAVKRLSRKNFDKKFICCNLSDSCSYFVYKHPKKGLLLIVTEMNDKLIGEAEKSIPRSAKQ